MPEVAARLGLVIGAAALLVLAVIVARRAAAASTGRLRAESPRKLWAALGEAPDGRPTLVAFSTPSCAACHTAQAPALRALQGDLGADAPRVITVDAASRPEVARTFGVLTVPSTVLLRSDGAVAAVNHGFAPASRLAEQVRAAQGSF